MRTLPSLLSSPDGPVAPPCARRCGRLSLDLTRPQSITGRAALGRRWPAWQEVSREPATQGQGLEQGWVPCPTPDTPASERFCLRPEGCSHPKAARVRSSRGRQSRGRGHDTETVWALRPHRTLWRRGGGGTVVRPRLPLAEGHFPTPRGRRSPGHTGRAVGSRADSALTRRPRHRPAGTGYYLGASFYAFEFEAKLILL